MRTAAALVAALAIPLAGSSAGPGAPAVALGELLGDLGFTPAQVAAVQRGEVVAVTLPGSVDREVAVAGAVRIAAAPERLVAVVRGRQ